MCLSDCKSNVWFFSIENLENTKKKKVQSQRNKRCQLPRPETHASCLSLCPAASLCASALYFFNQCWVTCHIGSSVCGVFHWTLVMRKCRMYQNGDIVGSPWVVEFEGPFFFIADAFGDISKKPLNLHLCLFLNKVNFVYSFRCMMYSELIFTYSIRLKSKSILLMWISSCPRTICWKDNSFSIEWSWTFVENQLKKNEWVYFWTLILLCRSTSLYLCQQHTVLITLHFNMFWNQKCETSNLSLFKRVF